MYMYACRRANHLSYRLYSGFHTELLAWGGERKLSCPSGGRGEGEHVPQKDLCWHIICMLTPVTVNWNRSTSELCSP